MGWSSVRVRLTLWNVLVLFLALGGFGFALTYSVQASQSAAIDRELLERSRFFTEPRPGSEPNPHRWRDFWRDFYKGAPARVFDPITRSWVLAPPGTPASRGPMPFGPGFRSSQPGTNTPSVRAGGNSPGNAIPPPDVPRDRERYFGRPRLFDVKGQPSNWSPDDKIFDRTAFHAALQGKANYSAAIVEGEPLRLYSTPLMEGGQVLGVAQIAHSLTEQHRLIDSQVRVLVTLLPIALLVTGLGGLFLANRALKPVRDVTRAAAQIGAEDLSQRLAVAGKDEMAELASTFNGMIARLEEAFAGQANAYHRLETAYEEQRRFTGDASHELRTPLARIKGATSLALLGADTHEEYREALTVADQAADVMNRIVQDLLLLARADAGQMVVRHSPVSVDELFAEAARSVEGLEGPAIHVESCESPTFVMGDVDHLTRMLVNLLSNAVRHTPAKGEVHLSAKCDDRGVALTVRDTGEGIPPEHLPHVCERFYRVDAARARADGGTGLGLAICQTIVNAHGGAMTVESEVGVGTTVTVRLSRAISAAAVVERQPQLVPA
jgi:signal transduction histidine kinase